MRIGLIALALASTCGSAQARIAPPVELARVPARLLVDIGSGQVLDQRQADRPFLPASTTKVMTAYVAFEAMAQGRLRPGQLFTVRPETARQWSGRGTSMYLVAGERVSAANLLHGVMTASANDAAVVLAEGHAGSVAGWTRLMNDAARRLGMTGSHFATPNGWPDGGRTVVTARDLARLAQAMITQYPAAYRAYSGKTRMVWKGVTLFSHDPVTGVVPGADGIKTGFTHEAGYNFLGSAQRDGRRLVAVIAGARSEAERASAARAYLEWGFSAWRKRPLFGAGATVARARVQGGSQRALALRTGTPVYAAIPANDASPIHLRAFYRGPIRAPVASGQRVGTLEIRVGSMLPGHVPLYAAQEVKRAGPVDRIVNGFMDMLS